MFNRKENIQILMNTLHILKEKKDTKMDLTEHICVMNHLFRFV